MGVNTLNDRSSGQTVTAEFFNSIHQALNGDIVGRGLNGVPTAGQSLGTISTPFGAVRANTVVVNGQSIDPSIATLPPNVVTSGAKRSTSNQPAFLIPNGSTLDMIVDGSPSLAYDVNGTAVSIDANIPVTGLTAGPSSNHTALVNDTDAADQADTRIWGEAWHRKRIIIDTAGSEITARVGQWAAFQMAGVTNEIFLAYIESATLLTKCMRGFFYDSSLNPSKPTGFSNNDTLTLLGLGHVFAEDDGSTIDVSYSNPTWAFDQPTGPATGDYWYDLGNQVWKRYDGASFQIINRTFLGWIVQSATACVAARAVDFYANYRRENDMVLEIESTSIIRAEQSNLSVNVAGRRINFYNSLPRWNITSDRANAADMYDATEQASTMYYLYIKDTGDTVISDIQPYWRPDLCGWYSRHNPWRCVGLAYNDGSSNLICVSDLSGKKKDKILAHTGNGNGAVYLFVRRFTTLEQNNSAALLYLDSANNGASMTCFWPSQVELNYNDYDNAASISIGITKNASITTLTSGPINRTTGMLAGFTTSTGTAFAEVEEFLLIGDVIHPVVVAGSPNDGDDSEIFSAKVGLMV